MNRTATILRRSDIDAILERITPDVVMREVIDRLGAAFTAVGRGEQQLSPARSGFVRDEASGVLEWMPHHDPGTSVTLKTIAYSPHNPRLHRMPTILGSIAQFDDRTGALVALADGSLTTALRTGAASAVASKLLARPDSEVIGLIGAGWQAVTQLHALCCVFPVAEVLVHDIEMEHASSFASRVSFMDTKVRLASPDEIAARSDIICTATSVPVGKGPVLPESRTKDHLHVNAVGSDLAGKTELTRNFLTRAFVCTDHADQAPVEGECQQLVGTERVTTLATLCADPSSAARRINEPTVFDSTGVALEDHVALEALLAYAADLGAGVQMAIDGEDAGAVNPYSSLSVARARNESPGVSGGFSPWEG